MPITQSPTPQQQMTFPEAMQALINDHRVTRLCPEWDDSYVQLRDGWLQIFTKNQWYTWSVSSVDMRGTDWVSLTKQLSHD